MFSRNVHERNKTSCYSELYSNEIQYILLKRFDRVQFTVINNFVYVPFDRILHNLRF